MKGTILCLLMATALCGCATALYTAQGNLYPVQGPLATPLTLAGGSVSATLSGGEVYQGSLQKIYRNDPAVRSMQEDWDRVYGSGYFVGQVLGQPLERATLAGSHGTNLSIELYNTKPALNLQGLTGVARDEKGSLFKVAF